MRFPRVRTAVAIDNRTLEIEFDNQQKKRYDITPLLQKELFAPLKNQALFRAVQVERQGYAVFWNNTIDISEHELWSGGR